MLVFIFWPFIQTFIVQIAPLVVLAFFLYLFLKNKNISSNNVILEKLVNEKTSQLKALALKYEAILKYVGEGIVTMDIDGKTEFANRACLKWLGLEEKDVIGRIWHEVAHYKKFDGSPYPVKECPLHEMFVDHKYDINTSLDDLAIRNQDYFVKGDGTFIDIEYVATPLFDYQERYVGAILVWHPIRTVSAKNRKISQGSHQRA